MEEKIMSLKAFLATNAKLPENKKVIISDRFVENGEPVAFEIKSVTEDINNKIRSRATLITTVKGKQQSKFESNKYLTDLCVASVVFPDLKSSELQDSYGVRGESDLLEVMLLPGEYATLLAEVQKINGYDNDKFEELKEEVKNS